MSGLTRISERRRLRHHGAAQHPDRRELERAGWRTTLEYRENHVRRRDGRLVELRVEWCAEAEHVTAGGRPLVVSARSSSLDRVWAKLRFEADVASVALAGRRAAPSPSPLHGLTLG
jgi:hypothetical protein